jgi:hypothetical protein
MQIKTLIAGYEPPKLDTLKGAQLKRHQYFQDTFAKFNFGELCYLSNEEAKKQIHDINPLLVLAFDEFTAEEINDIKADNLIYLIDTPNQIFSRKAEIEEKQEKLHKTLSEASGLLQEVRDGKKKEKDLRYFAALSYKDMYEMFKKAIISDDEKLKKSAWDTLFGEGERHSNIIWMRAQMMAELWEHAKGKAFEELMLMSMEQHIEQGTARKMDNFTDADGQEYYQYMFLDPYGNDTKHIRRLPFATKDQERYAYESLLEKNEVPINYMRVQIEANQLRDKWNEYLQVEYDKIVAVLDKWEKDPKLSRKELGVAPTADGGENDPLSDREVKSLKAMLKEDYFAKMKKYGDV